MLNFVLLFCLVHLAFFYPSADFAACCQRKGLPDECIKYCTYGALKKLRQEPRDILTQSKIQDEYTKIDVVAPFIQCMQKEKDNRDCCKNGMVDSEYPYCLDLCDGTRIISGVDNYLKCQLLGIRNRIVKCGKRA